MDLMPKDYRNKMGINNGSVKSNGSGFSAGGQNGVGQVKIKSAAIKPILVVVLFFLFVSSLAAYGGLFFYNLKLKKDIASQKKIHEEIVSRQDNVLLKKIVDAQSRGDTLLTLLKNHKHASKLIDALSETTLPQVQWISFSMDAAKNILTLSGESVNYKVLAQQITAFRKDKNWTSIEVAAANLTKEGVVSFSTEVGFGPDLLIKK